jgi:hypothetical protein
VPLPLRLGRPDAGSVVEPGTVTSSEVEDSVRFAVRDRTADVVELTTTAVDVTPSLTLTSVD